MAELAKNWLELVRQGDGDTFNQLYENYQGKIFRLAMKYCKNQMDAEEVVQDVFVAVFGKAKDFREESSFDTWVYRITVNACLMKLRSRKRNEHLSFEDNSFQIDRDIPVSQNAELGDWSRLTKISQSPLDQFCQGELKERLEQVGADMGRARWEAFSLSVIYGMSEKETAKKLGIKLSALKSRLHRSRRYLKKRMDTYLH
jgi:RNA polymerase sigma-70 factor (ECF subfamily)